MIDEIQDEYVKSWCEEYPKAFDFLISENNWPKDAEAFESDFEEAFKGTFDSILAFVDETISDLYGVDLSEWPFCHIDTDSAWDDMRHDNYWAYLEESGTVHIFQN